MKKSKTLIWYAILLGVSAAFFLTTFVFTLLTVFNRNIFGEITLLICILCIVLSIIDGFLTISSFFTLINQKRFLDQLRLQNKFALGHPTTFYDISAFRNRAIKLSRKARLNKRGQYIIAFSVASSEASYNSFMNESMTTLNYEVAMFLSNFFLNGKREKSDRYNVFAFDRGIFLIYSFSDSEEFIREIVTSTMNKVFEVVREKDLKIWAQPFFGARKVEQGDSLSVAIEDAMKARSRSEANFESYTVYSRKIETEESLNYLKELEEAIKENQFVPYYQPKYSIKEKKFISCEVLARWNSPTRGILSPATFIDKAEQLGLLSEIDILIFEKALIDINNQIKRGRRVIPASCNFSLYEFFSHSFLNTIIDLLQKYQVPPSLVEIEITETTSQVNQFLSISVIKKLKDIGIRVLMDDYGVGYSQIDNLKNIPFDGIKIDKSFSDNMLEDEKTRSIIKFLIELGHINDLEVIIEGVEKKEQVDILKKMHIDTIQGFYYSKPLPLKDYEEFLKHNDFEGGKE